MTTTHPSVQVPAERLASLQALLVEYGPYRREQLRKRLLSAAQQQRDEADHLRRSADAFRRTAALRKLRVSTAHPAQQRPEVFEQEATILEGMAAYVASYHRP
jgi:hypothetical protein